MLSALLGGAGEKARWNPQRGGVQRMSRCLEVLEQGEAGNRVLGVEKAWDLPLYLVRGN